MLSSPSPVQSLLRRKVIFGLVGGSLTLAAGGVSLTQMAQYMYQRISPHYITPAIDDGFLYFHHATPDLSLVSLQTKNKYFCYSFDSGSYLAQNHPSTTSTGISSFSADKRYAVSGNLFLDLQQGSAQTRTQLNAESRGYWSPDGSLIAFANRIYDVKQDAVIAELTPDLGIARMGWSPDSSKVAILAYNQSYNSLLLLWDRASSTLSNKGSARISLEYRSDSAIHWSPDGRWILINNETNIFLVSAYDFTFSPFKIDNRWSLGSTCWSPDGHYFAYEEKDNIIINKMNPDGAASECWRRDPDPVGGIDALAFTNNGQDIRYLTVFQACRRGDYQWR